MTPKERRRDNDSPEEESAMISAPRRLDSRPQAVARARRVVDLNPRNAPVLSAEEAFKLLRIDRTTGYKAIKDGTFPVPIIRVGRLIRIPTAALLGLLRLASDDHGKSAREDV